MWHERVKPNKSVMHWVQMVQSGLSTSTSSGPSRWFFPASASFPQAFAVQCCCEYQVSHLCRSLQFYFCSSFVYFPVLGVLTMLVSLHSQLCLFNPGSSLLGSTGPLCPGCHWKGSPGCRLRQTEGSPDLISVLQGSLFSVAWYPGSCKLLLYIFYWDFCLFPLRW